MEPRNIWRIALIASERQVHNKIRANIYSLLVTKPDADKNHFVLRLLHQWAMYTRWNLPRRLQHLHLPWKWRFPVHSKSMLQGRSVSRHTWRERVLRVVTQDFGNKNSFWDVFVVSLWSWHWIFLSDERFLKCFSKIWFSERIQLCDSFLGHVSSLLSPLKIFRIEIIPAS